MDQGGRLYLSESITPLGLTGYDQPTHGLLGQNTDTCIMGTMSATSDWHKLSVGFISDISILVATPE